MKKFRNHGHEPYRVVLIHGGPGAPGEMRPVGNELSKYFGSIEPFQSADSIDGQIHELKKLIISKCDVPVILVGFSWGAWLAMFLTVEFPMIVKKLILVGSGPFKPEYAEEITPTRESRLTDQERAEIHNLIIKIENSTGEEREEAFTRFGEIFSGTDTYEPIDDQDKTVVVFQPAIFQKIWPEADNLRKSGELLKMAAKITCPVTAIHGDYDPHPWHGVKEPLTEVLENFNFILLEKCGHKPWIEKYAQEKFYKVLIQECS